MVDYTANKHIEKPARGADPGTWDVPVNADWDTIDQAFGGVTSLSATTGTTPVVLTFEEYRSLALQIANQMNNNVTFVIPSGVGGQWVVQNTTTDNVGGPWTVTIASGGGGTSVVVDRNVNTTIFSDGTNISVIGGNPAPNSVNTASIQSGAVTYSKLAPAALATVAEYRAGGVGTATFTGSVVSSTSMTVTSVTGTILPGMVISGGSPAIATGTTIVSGPSGGGAGTYVISSSQTAAGSMTGTIPDTIVPTTTAWDSAGYVTLTPGATVTPDFSLGYNFSISLNDASTLANPTNVKIGQTGIIAVTEGSSSISATITGYIGASFNGTISGTTLTASSTLGTIILGTEVSGAGVTSGSTIVAYGSGSGSNGTYILNTASTVSSSTAMTAPNTTLTVTSVTGTIYVGMTLSGTGVTSGTKVLSQIDGTTGGVGTYTISAQQRVPSSGTSTTITGNIGPFFKEYGNYYVFPNGVKPTFNTTFNALNVMSYTVMPGPKILLTTFSGVTGAA